MSVKGGSFLFGGVSPGDVFTPEDVTAEQLTVFQTAQDFVRTEVRSHPDQLSRHDAAFTREFMLKAGGRGLFGADIEKEHGGTALGKIASTMIVAASAGAESFSVTWNAHAGIGMLPLAIFGNKAQKEKFLPGLAKGVKIAAYALTEPLAGSDALSIKTTATLSPDGKHYLLNGKKIFISNAGVADVFTTYAKVGGDKFTAFVVERGFGGITIGPEIQKMGIRGSSTAAVTFSNTPVPVENVLHTIGRGYEVAFCILDLGRFRLAVTCAERGKAAIENCVRWTKERVQFGKTLSRFGLVQQKLADMAIRTYFSESMVYRTTGLLEQAFAGMDTRAPGYGQQMYERISEFTVECSLSKVFSSEALGAIADEAVQLYGGRGYIEGNQAERMYRDARINRIFEGTNEINRLLAVRWVLRKAAAGESALFQTAQRLGAELPAMKQVVPGPNDGPLGYQMGLLGMARTILVLACATAARKYGAEIEGEEEVLGYLSDMMIEVFSMESGLLRASKALAAAGEEKSALKIEMCRVYVNEAMRRIEDNAIRILVAIETGDSLAALVSVVGKLTRVQPMDTIAARRRIAAAIIDAEKYVC